MTRLMPHRPRSLHPLIQRLGGIVYWNDWPARLAAGLGYRPAIRVRQHTVLVRDAPAQSPPLRLAFASDFHAGPMTHPDLLRGACDALAAADADVVLLGGDFVDRDAHRMRDIAARLGAVPARYGRFAVLGNHDYWTDPTRIADELQEAGIRLLTNCNAGLPHPFEHVWICGLDDPWGGRPESRGAFGGAGPIRIVLMHAPSGLLDIGSEPFDLALCGHTHGGQIALPGAHPIVVPHGPLSRRYSRGRYDLAEGRTLIVSVGLGCSGVPFRVFADPEILLCTLSPSPRDGS